MLALFIAWEFRFATFPIMPPRIFNSRSNAGALAVCFVHGFVYIADAYFLPQYFQVVLGASPLLSGVYLFPFIITLSVASIATGIYTKATGKVIPAIWFGMAFLILGHGLYIDLKPYASWARIIIFQILVGLGVGPNFQAPLIALYSGVQPRDMAAATATFGFARNLANAISVVIGGVIFQNQITAKQSTLEAALPADLVTKLSGGDAGSARDLVNSLPVRQQEVVVGVYTKSLQTLWIFYTCFAVLGLVGAFCIRSRVLSTTHEVTKTGLPQAADEGAVGEKERKADLESY